jgi:TatA/E family protein of Tat protein translocase
MMRKRRNANEKMLSVPHLVIIFLVALLVFGPEKLPELARKLGRATAEFKRATDGLRAGFEEHLRELEREAHLAEERKKPAENTIRAPMSETEGVASRAQTEEPAAAAAAAGDGAAVESGVPAAPPPK